MEKETWRDIPGYEGLYQASTLGRVRSVDRYIKYSNGREVFTKGKMLSLTLSKGNGRLQVNLSKNGKVEKTRPYVLVMLAFVGECPDNMEICHINGVKTDDRLENLKYDTISENRIDNYRYGSKNNRGKLSIEEVLEIRKLYKTGDYTQVDIAKMYNVKHYTIGRIIKRKTFAWLNDDGSIKESGTATTYKNNA